MTKRQWLKESGSWSVLSGLGEKAYDFYYMAMHDNGMGLFDADDYAWLNTLIGYDIGADKAKAIIRWLYENDQSVMSFEAGDIETLKNICELELGLHIDFSNAAKETPKAISYEWGTEMYRLKAWKESEECNFSDFTTYREAQEFGEQFYPGGYDIKNVDTEED